MKILKAIESCRKSKKDYLAEDGKISASLWYDDEDATVFIDFVDEEIGYGMGHIIHKEDTEVEIIKLLSELFTKQLEDLDFEQTND